MGRWTHWEVKKISVSVSGVMIPKLWYMLLEPGVCTWRGIFLLLINLIYQGSKTYCTLKMLRVVYIIICTKWYLPFHVYRISPPNSSSPTFSVTPGVFLYPISMKCHIYILLAWDLSHHLISIILIIKKVLLVVITTPRKKSLLMGHVWKYQLLIL